MFNISNTTQRSTAVAEGKTTSSGKSISVATVIEIFGAAR